MNKRSKFIAQVGFYALALGLMAYAAMRTLDFVQGTMPLEKQFWGYLFLLSTGVGAIIWLMVYLWLAEGAKQRGLAFMMGIIDLLGEMFMVYADTVRVSADNGQLTMSPTDLQTFIMGSVAVIAVNIVAAYAFHLFDPQTERESQARDLVDEVAEAAMKSLNTPQAKQNMIDDLAPTLKSAILDEVTAQVREQAGVHIRRALTRGPVLPAPLEVPPVPLKFPWQKRDVNDLTQAVAVEMPRKYPADVAGTAVRRCYECHGENKKDYGLYCSVACERKALLRDLADLEGRSDSVPAPARDLPLEGIAAHEGGDAAPTAAPFPDRETWLDDGHQGQPD